MGFYKEALKKDPNHYETLWRLARAFTALATASRDRAVNRDLGWQGYHYGLRAIAQKPGRVEGHFWAALCIGAYGKGLGALSAIRQGIVAKLKKHLNAAMRINRSYQHGGADRVYAIYYHRLPWPMRDNKKSLDHFRKSLTYDRDHTLTHFHMAKVLAAEGHQREAKNHLKVCIQSRDERKSHWVRRSHSRCKSLLKQLGD